ncbi:DNA-binding response regulator [Paenibacillus sp. 598K]|uniref:response regulator transcription factor n=1 Tax=Paenibacillus sp. 598K TaxID=1117987 RepID=UPI000FF9AFE9|nr:response regulator [Paenibacillus sp. 598K]GBF76377.1 DNA-binding response regulator [Paenibacillus sp. 598K]
MYTVLIADDDRLIREDLGSMIDWQASGFRLVGEADHGAEALGLAETLKPDLILTDINMPVMDGIELIRRVKARRPQTKILVMSNYDDFQYVKEAMKLGATDYVLKYTLDPPALTAMLEQLHGLIAEERTAAQRLADMELAGREGRQRQLERFASRLLHDADTSEAMVEQARALSLPLSGGSWLLLLVAGAAERETLAQQARSDGEATDSVFVAELAPALHAVMLHTVQRSYLMLRQRSHSAAQAIVRAEARPGLAVLMGEPVERLSDLPTQWARLQAAREAAFYDGAKPLQYVSATAGPAFRRRDEAATDRGEAALLHALRTHQPDEARAELQGVLDLLREIRVAPEEARDYLYLLFSQMAKAMKASDPAFADRPDTVAFQRLLTARSYTLDELEAELGRLLDAYWRTVETSAYAGYRSEIKKALAFLERNYSRELSLLEVADHVGLSRNHFCKLFKLETGDNFINALNGIRIDRARELLGQSDARVKEIAGQVGLPNYRYFCRIFKAVTGMTPTDYKQSGEPRQQSQR